MAFCLRCNAALTQDEPETPGISFYACLDCACHYARKPGEELHDRWLMPLSLPLYAVIFEKNPEAQAVSVAHEFCDRDNRELDMLEQHIEDELRHPKQKVSQILDYKYANEQQLRDYLRLFLAALKELRSK